MRLSTSIGLSGGVAAGGAPPPPSDLSGFNLTGAWLASYAGAPWLPAASGGSSGSHGNLVVSGTAPGVGMAQNGLTPADLNGTTQRLVSATATTSFVSQAAGTLIALFLADAVAAQSAGYDDASIVTNGNAEFAMTITAAGVSAMVNDGSYRVVNSACGTGAYHIARVRWDSTTLGVTVDSGVEATRPGTGALSTLTADTLIVGVNYGNAAFFDGRLLALLTADTALSDGDYAGIKTVLNTLFGLAL